MLVPENQRRQYIYRGVCIARYNKGICSSFKLYNVYPDGGPVIQVCGGWFQGGGSGGMFPGVVRASESPNSSNVIHYMRQ